MIFHSLLPPIPDPPFPNAHHLFLNRPDQAEWEDYDLHVDAPTGKVRKWHEFKDRVKRGATAFGDPGLFPCEENEIVGVLSENCVVSFVSLASESCANRKAPWVWMRVGVCDAHSLAVGRGYSIRSIPSVPESIRTKASRQSLQCRKDLYEHTESQECPDDRQGSWILGVRWNLHPRRKGEGEAVVR